MADEMAFDPGAAADDPPSADTASTRSHRAQRTKKGYPKMRDGIQQRGKNSYFWCASARDPKTGETIKGKGTVPGPRENAKAARAAFLANPKKEEPEPETESVGDWLKYWLEVIVPIKAAPKSRDLYESHVRVHLNPAFGETPLNELQPSQVQELYARLQAGDPEREKRPLAANTIHAIHRTLRAALRAAQQMDKLTRWPLRGVAVPSPVSKMHQAGEQGLLPVYTPQELAIVLDKLPDTDFGIAVHIAAWTGMRRGEICALRWSSVDLENDLVRVIGSVSDLSASGRGASRRPHRHVFKGPKTRSSRRTIKVDRELTTILLRRRQHLVGDGQVGHVEMRSNALVVPGADGDYLCPQELSKEWKQFYERCLRPIGLRFIRFHDLRHTHASILLAQGKDLHVVKVRLGHSSIQITADTYGHLLPGVDEGAASAFGSVLRAARAAQASSQADSVEAKPSEAGD